MGFFSIILMIIQYGPAIFHLITEIIDLLKRMQSSDVKNVAAYEVDLKKAIDFYKKTGDRGPLRELRDRLRGVCFGPNCPK